MGTHLPPQLQINPPLLNSSNPWATTLDDLRTLYGCSSIGAVTTRTSLLGGFPHDEHKHRFVFFDTSQPRHQSRPLSVPSTEEPIGAGERHAFSPQQASLNNLGYSPIPLDEYLEYISTIDNQEPLGHGHEPDANKSRGFIVSVTGTPQEVAECYRRIARLQFGTADEQVAKEAKGVRLPLAMEVNLSCPNIPGKPPPAYDGAALASYVRCIAGAVLETAAVYNAMQQGEGRDCRLPWGLKIPPYTHAGEFDMFIGVLRDCSRHGDISGSVSFVTATNTLGSCLILKDSPSKPAHTTSLPGTGLGGLAGAPLHPLALGNVHTLRGLLDADDGTKHISLIGIGGVSDADGYRRMRAVGAMAVGVGTALGRQGIDVFSDIGHELVAS